MCAAAEDAPSGPVLISASFTVTIFSFPFQQSRWLQSSQNSQRKKRGEGCDREIDEEHQRQNRGMGESSTMEVAFADSPCCCGAHDEASTDTCQGKNECLEKEQRHKMPLRAAKRLHERE